MEKNHMAGLFATTLIVSGFGFFGISMWGFMCAAINPPIKAIDDTTVGSLTAFSLLLLSISVACLWGAQTLLIH
jgi:hypothetical protein